MKLLLKIKESDKSRFFYLLLVLLVGLVVADGTITRFIIKNQLGMEANPFLKEWVQSDAFLIIKLVGSGLAALILWRLYLRSHKIGWILTLFFVIVYSLLIIWNIVAFFITMNLPERTGTVIIKSGKFVNKTEYIC